MKYLPILAVFLLAACGSGPGTAPQPPINDSGTISGGTANDIYHR